MQSKAKTVKEYLAALPADRREALQAVREVFLKNLDKDYEEGMQYGMIGYYVPHRVFPQGYHCDPKQPLPYASLASQKNHMSLGLMCVYMGAAERKAFESAWKKTGKKLDMGATCIRFKKAEDLALELIGRTIKSVPAKAYIAQYETLLQARTKAAGKKPAKAKSRKKL